VSTLCQVKAHVLRYWEQEFDQLKPVKRRGNRRYYQPHEVQLVRDIRGLLYDQGFTISGARAILDSNIPRLKLSDAPLSHTGQTTVVQLDSAPSDTALAPDFQSTTQINAPDAQARSVQDAMAGMISGTVHATSISPSLDLHALKRELQSILDLLHSQ
jgi:DNA-binding transcriptional MerR regulator